MDDLKIYLEGGNLRSIADVDQLIPLIETQKDFELTAQEVKTEGISSINARIRKLLSA